MNKEIHFIGKPCPRGHRLRYKTGRHCVQCMSDRGATYRRDPQKREQKRISRAKHYRRNKERIAIQVAAWQAVNQERKREAQRMWRETHPDKCRAYTKAWVERNAERVREGARAYQKAHPDKTRANCAAYRARKRAVAIGCRIAYEAFLRWVRTEPDIRCEYCRRSTAPKERHVDHYVPLSRGGPDEVENLRVACAECNLHKHAQLPEEFMARVG